MKTKIIMMTALLALLATGCGKDGDSRIRIFAENMTAAGNGSKLQINPADPVNSVQWIAGEYININGTQFEVQGDDATYYSIDVAGLDGATFYAVYPGKSDDDNYNDVTVTNSNTTATITLNRLTLDFHDDGAGNLVHHSVVFPMGAKASNGDGEIRFKNLTAAFRLHLSAAATPVTLKKLKVIVYGTGAAPACTTAVDGVSYTVAWKGQGPAVPTGNVGSLTDRDVTYASEMNFDMLTDGSEGVEVDGDLKFCIPVTLTTVRRITVIGYNGDDVVFSTTSTMNGGNVQLERSRMYPVAKITINE